MGIAKCKTCLMPANIPCGNCKIVNYCTARCQLRDWDNHKEACYKTISFEEMIPKIWNIFMNGENSLAIACLYFGNKVIDGKRYWFMEDQERHIQGNIKDWFTSVERIGKYSKPMDDEEFFSFFLSGKCCLYSIPLAYALIHSMNSKLRRRFTYMGKAVTRVVLTRCVVTQEFTPNLIVYEKWPIPANKPPHKWDADLVGDSGHTVLTLVLEGGEQWVVDFTAAQFGIQTQKDGARLHVEKVNLLTTDFVFPQVIGMMSYAKVIGNKDPSVAWDELCGSPDEPISYISKRFYEKFMELF